MTSASSTLSSFFYYENVFRHCMCKSTLLKKITGLDDLKALTALTFSSFKEPKTQVSGLIILT